MRLSNKLLWLAALMVVVSLSLASSDVELRDQTRVAGPDNKQPGSARDKFRLPKIFDFQLYKRLFHKAYGRLEEVARQKYVLARAFRAWTSSIKYKFRKSSFYLALNQLSDRSPEELRRRVNHHSSLNREELRNLKPVDDLTFKKSNNLASRRTHALDGQPRGELRHLDEDKLISTGEGVQLDPEVVEKLEPNPESNNPDHVAPGLPNTEQENKEVNETISQMAWNRPLSAEELSGLHDGIDEHAWYQNYTPSYFAGRDNPALPDEVFLDHRDSQCMFLPRDQGDCGSCYAFAMTTIAEWLYCMQTGELVAFSEQYLVDCGARVGSNGCKGGDFKKVGTFIHNFGVELRANYPYRDREDQCPYEASASPKSMGFIRIQLDAAFSSPIKRLEEYIQYGPMYIAVCLTPAFYEYGGGVWDGADCKVSGDHAVVLIGHGREDGKEYWLVRNSWSVGWGESGHFKLAKETDCIHERIGTLYGSKFGSDSVYQVAQNTHTDPKIIKTHYRNNLPKKGEVKL